MSAGFWPGLPYDASLDGHRIVSLLHASHLLVGGLLAVACGALIALCLSNARRRRPVAAFITGSSRRQLWLAFGLSVLVFGAIDNTLAVRSFADVDQVFWNHGVAHADPRTVRIEVNAHQWAWDARYAGEDGLFETADDIVTWNDFKIPCGRKVLLQLTSTDVIHNFYLPNFMVKMDAVPGRVNQLWFQAQETGLFEVACSQHCGVAHYKMRARLEVLFDHQFEEWARAASDNARRGYDPADAAAHWGWAWRPR